MHRPVTVEVFVLYKSPKMWEQILTKLGVIMNHAQWAKRNKSRCLIRRAQWLDLKIVVLQSVVFKFLPYSMEGAPPADMQNAEMADQICAQM